MIIFMLKFFFLIHLINGQGKIYNLFMPDLPPSRSSSSSSSSISSTTRTRVTHSFTTRLFTKIHLFDGPFHLQLYQNMNVNNNYTSVDVETQESIQEFLSIDVEQNDILVIRMLKHFPIDTKINITILIIYRQLNEIAIDGLINLQSLNQIHTNIFRLHHRGIGSIKLKFNVNLFDAYLHSIGDVEFSGQVLHDATIKSLSIGNVNCRNLLTRRINIVSSGIGNVYIVAIDEINITLSGIGIVYYTGPLKQQIQIGLGKIIDQSELFSSNNQSIIDVDLD